VAIAVLSLALGVGVNSIVFSLVDGMFLRDDSIRGVTARVPLAA
jgi:hypothetical protein